MQLADVTAAVVASHVGTASSAGCSLSDLAPCCCAWEGIRGCSPRLGPGIHVGDLEELPGVAAPSSNRFNHVGSEPADGGLSISLTLSLSGNPAFQINIINLLKRERESSSCLVR